MTEQVTFLLRDGYSTGATGWTAVNPVLAQGEPGFEVDTTTLKIGNGSTGWNDLDMLRFGTRVAIGRHTGDYQGDNSIAIGRDTGYKQGENSIAIGLQAGISFGSEIIIIPPFPPISIPIVYTQSANTIILNASGSALAGISGQTGSFYVAPIREDLTKTVPLLYDPVTHEIVQGASGIMGPMGPMGPTGTGLLSGITFCGLNFTQGSGGLYSPPYNVDIQIPGLTTTSNVQVTAKLTDNSQDYPTCSILYVETTTDTLTVYVSSNPNFDGYGLMWNVINF
jgi:hypothetical protein